MNDDAIREAGWTPQTMLLALMSAEGGHDMSDIEWADAVIDAVRPLIEADLRERLAAAIAREWADVQNRNLYDGSYRDGYLDGLERAEVVVRNRP